MKKFRRIIDWVMLISMIVVLVSGILLKPFPGMWLGISHGVSGYLLAICGFVHCIQNGMFRFKK